MNQNGKVLNASKKFLRGVSRLGTDPFRALVLALISVFGCNECSYAAAISPFVARGKVSTRSFEAGKTNVMFAKQGAYLFEFSNGWWRVQCEYQDDALRESENQRGSDLRIVVDCARVQDGVRWFATSVKNQTDGNTNKAIPAATALPIQFPPPEQPVLLIPWLALCPSPELPILDKEYMRRFAVSSRMNDPNNKAKYNIEYLSESSMVLRRLQVTNLGFLFVLGGGVTKLPKPFDDGFLEHSYEVLETTEYERILFPKKSTLSKFWPSRSKDSPRVDLVEISTLEVDSIAPLVERIPTPDRVYVSDYRPVKSGPADYVVVQDKWKDVKDLKLQMLANTQSAKRPVSKMTTGHRAIIFRICLLSSFVLAGLYTYRAITKSKKTNT